MATFSVESFDAVVGSGVKRMKGDIRAVAVRFRCGGGKDKLKALWWMAVLAVLLVPALAYALEARVQRALDGRTVVLSNGDKVRYIGVEIPDDLLSVTQATNVNRDLVEGADVRLEFDKQLRDKDGNLLAYVYVGDLMVNEYLIRTGYARVESYSLNRRFLTRMLHLQAGASRERLGIWSRATGEQAPVPEMKEEIEWEEEEWQIEGEELPALEEAETPAEAPELEEAVPSPATPEGEDVVIEGE